MNEPYEFLETVGLQKTKDVRKVLSRWSYNDVIGFLVNYSNMSSKRQPPTQAAPGTLSILPDSQSDIFGLSTLKQLSLYLDRVYLHDPIPGILRKYQEIGIMPDPSSRTDRKIELRSQLISTLEHLVEIKPLATIGVISIQPTYLSELAQPPGAMYLDDVFHDDGTPAQDPMDGLDCKADLEKYVAENVEIFLVDPVTQRPISKQNANLNTSRAIGVQIRGDAFSTVRMFFEIMPESLNEGTHEFQMRLDHRSVIDQTKFNNWKNAEAKKLVVRRLRRIQRDISLARLVGATLLTDITVTHDLMPYAAGAKTKESKYARSLLELQLPFFDQVSISSLAKARADELAYSEFRSQLTKVLHELSAIDDEAERARRGNELVRDIIELPLQRINQANVRLRELLFINCGIAIGSLAGLLLSSQSGPLNGAALAGLSVLAEVKAMEGLKEHLKQRDILKNTPGFFYWRATK